MLTVSTASTLEDEGFTVCCVCPGYVNTALTGYQGFKDPNDGAKVILTTVGAEKADVHGQFVHEEGGPLGKYEW